MTIKKTSGVVYQLNEQSPLTLTHWTHKKGDNVIWCWKSRSWLGTGTKIWWGYIAKCIPLLLMVHKTACGFGGSSEKNVSPH